MEKQEHHIDQTPREQIEKTEDTLPKTELKENVPSKARRWLFFSPIFLFAIVFLGTYLVLNLAEEPVAEQPVLSEPEVVITKDSIHKNTIVLQEITHERCGHVTTETLQNNPKLVDKEYDALIAEGWEIANIGTNKVRMSKSEYDFCPTDAEKRTIRKNGDGLAVYQGPKTAAGDLLLELSVNIEELPDDWQQDLSKDGVEFATETELLEAMENLDEMVTSTNYENYDFWDRYAV